MKKAAIVGFGRFGQFLSQILLEHTDWEIIVVSSKKHSSKNSRLSFASYQDLKTADIVFPVVSISIFDGAIKKIAPFIDKHAVVIDVCSVMGSPAKSMKKHLPKTVELVATHPVFGPDTFQKNGGLHDLPIVLFPLRCQKKTFLEIKNFCKKLKLKILEMTPEQHDKYVAYTQAYSFLIGKIGQKMNLQQTPLDTWSYKQLREQSAIIQNDSDQLFTDIQKQNPFAKKMRAKFKKTVQALLAEIDDR